MPAVYFVAVVTNAKQVLEKTKSLYPADSIFCLADDKFFVATDDTSMTLSTKIGVRDGSVGTGIAMRLTTYNGRATSSLWEWLGSKADK